MEVNKEVEFFDRFESQHEDYDVLGDLAYRQLLGVFARLVQSRPGQNCIDLGCPAIFVARRETVTTKSGKPKELSFARIDSNACTGCRLCVGTCAPEAIVQNPPPPAATHSRQPIWIHTAP